MTYKPTIFPTLIGCTWAEVDLGEHASKNFPDIHAQNKLLDAAFCDAWVKKIAHDHGVDFTWGGAF